jgi:ureidoglycolate dehydrogenase (NAD+)
VTRWRDPALVRDVADILVESSLSGVHTHGVRLLGGYLDELGRGVANADAEPKIVKDTGPVVHMDAADALGVVAGLHGAEKTSRWLR